MNEFPYLQTCAPASHTARVPLNDDVCPFQVILLRNYQKSRVKHEWLSGRYSNIRSPVSLPEQAMCPMDADTWGEILDAELEREAEKSQ